MTNPIITLISLNPRWATPDGTPVTLSLDDSPLELTPEGAKPRSRAIPKIAFLVDGIITLTPQVLLGGPMVIQDYLSYPADGPVTGRFFPTNLPVVVTSPATDTLLLTFPTLELTLTLNKQ